MPYSSPWLELLRPAGLALAHLPDEHQFSQLRQRLGRLGALLPLVRRHPVATLVAMVAKPGRMLHETWDDGRLRRNRLTNPLLECILDGPRLVLDVTVAPRRVVVALVIGHWRVRQEGLRLPPDLHPVLQCQC